MSFFEKHVFVCTNERHDGREACKNSGSQEVLTTLKEAAKKDPALRGKVRINVAGCLGQCKSGPTMVVYPEGVWYKGVTVADVPEILESHLKNGVPVARLRNFTRED